ncbi:membrane protein [Chania multitudinisentens RB-25]|uniref:Membrane protein n=1 Tax=Chania multitudinisentens RB-25 TaxID=1441930 RepID=W0L508_9GAMM|nr:SLC13 family permease [Chania multitudinisentens]AHG18806.1 membrane protein [Chania multitudinisentens RB-25]
MSSHAVTRLLRPFIRDRLLHILLLIGVLLFAIEPQPLSVFRHVIDWRTINTLLGLMLLTKGVEVSGYFDFIGRQIINALHSERWLALFLVFSAALLSSFLTNDVALFIVIPLTITLKKLSALPVNRLIIFQALAVNVGSLLTPIGNPQNILLWGESSLSFMAFIGQMAPLAAALMLSLLAITWLSFPARNIVKKAPTQSYPYQKLLLLGCVVLYGVFLVSLELAQPLYGLLTVFIGFLLLARRVLLQIDWSLIFVFIMMFIDIKLFTELQVMQPLFSGISALPDSAVYSLGIGLSQVISNVPATILLLNYVPSSALLAYAVNAGGFGLAIGSLANLIALRMAGDRRIWLHFHYYSLPFLAWAALIGWLLL